MTRLPILALFVLYCCSCTSFKRISRSQADSFLSDPALKNAHVGISVFEPGTGNYWYSHNADKYFVPASNTKLVTCYAAMKHLGDSLPGLRYRITSEAIDVLPTGDPTFLHPDFPRSPVVNFYLSNAARIFSFQASPIWQELPWGEGWAWDDYEGDYSAERSPFPIYGNVVSFKRTAALSANTNDSGYQVSGLASEPSYFKSTLHATRPIQGNLFSIHRALSTNNFTIEPSSLSFKEESIPFVTNGQEEFLRLLADTIHLKAVSNIDETTIPQGSYRPGSQKPGELNSYYTIIHSQPTDSMLRLMMYRSDNFFAEQSLLMVSNELLGVMSDRMVIDTLLKTDYKDLPQAPHWVDGSGLSRYDLFTPMDFVAILDKMRVDFGMERMKKILPTGNTGTLTNHYKPMQGYIFAKTGSLSNVIALSGFLYTKKNKLLIFSVLVNNATSPGSKVRGAMETFLENIWEKN